MAAQSPGYEVAYEDEETYLVARVSGPQDTVTISLRYWNEIAEECRRRGLGRLLVVEHFQTCVSIAEVYDVAQRLPAIVRGLRVAFVDENAEEYDANTFGENVAVNRGAIGRVFRDEASAREWLRES